MLPHLMNLTVMYLEHPWTYSLTFMTGLDSNGSHPQRRFFHALCVHMTIPMSLLQFSHAAYGIPFCCSHVFSAITCPPDLHYHSILRGTFQFSAV